MNILKNINKYLIIYSVILSVAFLVFLEHEKKLKDEKCAKNLENSAANKNKEQSSPKTDIKVIDLSNITSNKNDNKQYKDVIVSLLNYLNAI